MSLVKMQKVLKGKLTVKEVPGVCATAYKADGWSVRSAAEERKSPSTPAPMANSDQRAAQKEAAKQAAKDAAKAGGSKRGGKDDPSNGADGEAGKGGLDV